MVLIRSAVFIPILFLVALLFAAGCSTAEPLPRFDYAQVIMGVRVNIAAYCASEVKAQEAAAAAFAEMARVDDALSDYRPDSEAMRLCDAAPSVPVPVSPLLAAVLRRSVEFSQAGEGAFDITAGPLVQLWRQARREGKLPSPEALSAARQSVGWHLFTLSTDARGRATVTLAARGVRLDFGGIGKGYAADRGLAVMRQLGVPRCLIAAAGDIAVGDPPPDRFGWRIELAEASVIPLRALSPAPRGGDVRVLEDRGGLEGGGGGRVFEAGDGASDPPRSATRSLFVEVSRCGVSTSGDTEQFLEIEGVRYSHIIDPRTAMALTRRTLVTTVAPDATTADAAATTLCVLAPERRAAFLRRFPGTVAWVRLADQPGFGESVMRGFPTIRRDQ